MIATDYVTVQEQLLALSLYDETTAKTVAAIPTEQFDQWRQPIHGAISQTIKEDALLTRTGLKAYLNEHKPTPEFTPSDMAGQITIYNRLFMDGVTMKPDDAPPLISLLAKIKPSIPRISQLFEPFDMTKHFLASPKQIQRLAQLIYTICPKTPPVACFWLAMTLVGACCGKYIVGRNGTQKLYLNLWANILTPSGKGKSEIKEIQPLH